MSASPAMDEHERLAPVLRNRLQSQQSALKSAFEQKPDPGRLLRTYCRVVDALLRDIWQQYGLAEHACLIAVGGYGRGELFPHSDVDLLILMPEDADAALNQRIESLIGLFWDIGLAVGHSVRTLDECIIEADNDVTIRTNLLEARLLIGNTAAYAKFDQAIDSDVDARLFFAAKLREQEQRHARYHDTAYNLEPNIKESPGGLRDLQTILWISRSMELGTSWHALVKHGLISEREARQIRRHELHLQLLRIRLHYLANRREDRLLFDFQNDLARQLGYVDSGRKRASEQLMHGYYRSAKYIGLINEILLKLLQERIRSGPDRISSINIRFQARNGLLEARSAGLLQKNPSAILESFLLLQQHSELRGMGVNLLRNLHRVKNLVNLEFRQDSANKALFLQILQQPTGVTNALSLMNRYGILGRYIPAFGRIVGQMQHDLFHVYTVDEHILNVLGNLRRFAHPEFAHEFPLCSKLFGTFERPHLLYLGALFHDIAKGRGGDHSKLGTRDAQRFCKMHGLPAEDTDLVAWLVESHLLMSATAQKSDLADTAVIERFAKLVGSERRLIALYLLTVADIRGTSPKIWNAWKAKLLEHLYSVTRHALRGNATNTNAELQLRQQQAHATLNYYGIAEQAYLSLWEKLGRLYFMRHESQEIAWHSRLLLTHINTAEAIVRARLSPGGDGIQAMIYTRDRDDLFARICGFFERIGYTIVEAKVHTTQHGYALDSFLVLDPSDHAIHYRDLLNYIEYELTQKLLSTGLPSPPQGRVSRQVKHMPIPAEVTVSYDASSRNHVLDVVASDRPGLLSRIAQVFLEYGVHLHTAKINTLGSRIEDTFLISAKDNRKLSNQVTQAMKAKLLATLS
jgi:[protein-PII] uridylyltransferase